MANEDVGPPLGSVPARMIGSKGGGLRREDVGPKREWIVRSHIEEGNITYFRIVWSVLKFLRGSPYEEA